MTSNSPPSFSTSGFIVEISIVWNRLFVTVGLFLGLSATATGAMAAGLFVGAASVDITPTPPVALLGQSRLRIAEQVDTPLTANAIALESRNGDTSLDMAVMVSCDLLWAPPEVLERIRNEVRKRLPPLDAKKLFLNATHTHTAPVVGVADKADMSYAIPASGVMQPEEYQIFLAQRIADAVVKAWNGRIRASFTWGLSDAMVAQSRRVIYADGHAEMYGSANRPDFRGLEGYEDHDVGTLFFWDKAGTLMAIAINVACPAQELESINHVDADFWHPVRESLRRRYGKDVCILGWTGAAGDQSPHPLYRKEADARMIRLRGLTRVQEIARRIVRSVEETYEAVANDRHSDVSFTHNVETVRLPMRLVTEAECSAAKAAIARLEKDHAASNVSRRIRYEQRAVERFERQNTDPHPAYEMEMHVLRIGDVAVCTCPFELFTDYGIQIKARSNAVQTFVIQLVGMGTYLPTEKAIRGGGYSTAIQSNQVGPEGGQLLVERTVEVLTGMWASPR